MSDDTLISVRGVSKKFCRSLKKSLWYGLQDMGCELIGGRQESSGESTVSGLRSTVSSSPALRAGEFWAVNDVSFELKRGECLGLIGRNGAGKTTLLKMLNGLIKPDHGTITMRGRVGALIALGAGFNPILTGRENIYVNASVLGLTKSETDAKMDEIIDFAEISDFIDTPVQSYSSGMAVRLGFAVATSVEPNVLLVDEVLAVGDLGFRYKCFRRISELMDRAAVIFVSHDMASVARLANRVMLLEQGNILESSDDSPAVIQRYNKLFMAEGRMQSGTGEIDVTDISVKSLTKCTESAGIQYGDDLVVEFTIAFRAAIPEVNLNVTFLDQVGNQVAQCLSARTGFSIQMKNSPQRIRMVYRALPFIPGEYSLWLVVYKPEDILTYSVHYRVCPFTVTGEHLGYIPVQPVAEWSLINDILSKSG